MCTAFGFYFVIFYMKYFPGNIFENFIAFSIADSVAYSMSGVLLKKTNLSKALIISYTISSVSGICYLFLYDNDNAFTVIIIMCKMGISMSYNILFVSVGILFPT